MAKITVEETEVTILQINNEDYISLTDMAHTKWKNILLSNGSA